MGDRQTSSAVNGRLWGSAATDWAAIQEPTCRPVYQAVFERVGLKAGERYLDAGCGAGLAAQMAAARGVQVFGLDAAENLLAVARSRVLDGEFHLGELESLPFADGAFDLVTGWGDPAGMEAASLVAALRPLLPPPPPGAPGPFALSDEAALRAFALSAGLRPVEVLDVDAPWCYADLATALRGLGSSGVAVRAMDQSGAQAVEDAHAKALAPFRQGDGRYRVAARFRCLITQS